MSHIKQQASISTAKRKFTRVKKRSVLAEWSTGTFRTFGENTMDRETSREYFVVLSNCLIKGDWKVVLQCLQSPLVVFVEERPYVLNSQKIVQHTFSQYRRTLIEKGAHAAAINVAENCYPAEKRKSVVVSKTFLDWNSTEVGKVKARYFLEGSERRNKVVMIEYLMNTFFDHRWFGSGLHGS